MRLKLDLHDLYNSSRDSTAPKPLDRRRSHGRLQGRCGLLRYCSALPASRPALRRAWPGRWWGPSARGVEDAALLWPHRVSSFEGGGQPPIGTGLFVTPKVEEASRRSDEADKREAAAVRERRGIGVAAGRLGDGLTEGSPGPVGTGGSCTVGTDTVGTGAGSGDRVGPAGAPGPGPAGAGATVAGAAVAGAAGPGCAGFAGCAGRVAGCCWRPGEPERDAPLEG